MKQRVKIVTRTVGQAFATIGDILDARTGKRLATGQERPYGFTTAARDSAESVAEKNGWQIVEDAE